VCACMYVAAYLYAYVCVGICMFTRCECACIRVRVYVCLYVCM
jgi:hypothetical protein